MCAWNNDSARGATFYFTTFPCHNCAKQIIAAGVKIHIRKNGDLSQAILLV